MTSTAARLTEPVPATPRPPHLERQCGRPLDRASDALAPAIDLARRIGGTLRAGV